MVDLSRILNVASVVLFINTLVGVVYGLLALFAPLDEGLLGVTTSEIGAFSQTLLDFLRYQSRIFGLYLLCTALVLGIISLTRLWKGEKWAWYIFAGIGGISLLGQLVLFYTALPSFVPIGLGLVIVWIVGIALSAKEIFS